MMQNSIGIDQIKILFCKIFGKKINHICLGIINIF